MTETQIADIIRSHAFRDLSSPESITAGIASAVAALRAPSSTPARQEEGSRGDVPAGWVLVPREPTAGMMLAARDHHSRETAHEDHRISIYRAMLSASPAPDATSGGDAAGGDDQTGFGHLRAYEAVAKALEDASYTAFEPDARRYVVVETVSKVLEAFRLSPAAPHPSQEKGEADV